jgi:soluble lytic murein transglycosylase-like protein
MDDDAPPSLTTFFLIEKYSKLYSIPKYIVYNIAYRETNYKGPYDWNYNPFVSSNAGADGPMQIKLSTANEINDTTTKRGVLKNNLEYNISTCFKLLDTLYKQYHDWGKVCGCYNTGSPVSNDYSRFCASNKDYRKNWVNYNE